MLCLAIDTTGSFCSAALVDEGGPLAVQSEDIGRGHAERLMPMIDGILAEAGRTYDDLDRIGVTTGPGSFTGIRVGISVARGLALALDIEALGVSVLDLLIERAGRTADGPVTRTIIASVPAARGDLFVQAVRYRRKTGGKRDLVLPPSRMAPDRIGDWIGGLKGPCVLAGPGSPAIAEVSLLPNAGPEPVGRADIVVLAELAIRGDGNSPPRPLYLRPPDARPQSGKAVLRA